MKFFILISFIKLISCLTLECEFRIDRWYGYSCLVKSLEIISESDRTITDVKGNQLEGKNFEDLKYFESRSKVLNYFPRNLEKFFENLEGINIQSGGLKEISVDDLKPFGEKLKYLFLWNNEIKILKSNLFDFNPNLKFLYLSHNKIEKVEKGTFDKLEKLQEFDFENNECYLIDAYSGATIEEYMENDQKLRKVHERESLAKLIEENC